MSKFESEEKVKEFIDKLEQAIKSYDDEISYINQSITDTKNNIKSIELLQDQQRQLNYQNWIELPMLDTQISDPEPEVTTIETILGEIL